MPSEKIILKVCRSCVSQNLQSDPALQSETALRVTYESKIKKGLFGKIAELQIVDCLTNCENPNAVQIDRADGEMLFGKISNEALVDEVIQLVRELRDPSKPFVPSENLKPCLVFVRPHLQWRPGNHAAHADRIRLDRNPS
jgi:predicted metal-binding protein